MGRRAIADAGHSAIDAAGDRSLKRPVWKHARDLRGHSDCRDCRRPAGRIIWPDVYLAGDGEMHLRDGCVHAAAHWHTADDLKEPPADDDCLEDWRYG